MDPGFRPRTGTVERRGTAQQRTTDPVSESLSPFRTLRYAAAFSFFFGASVKKLLGDRIRVQYSDPDLPELIRVFRASHSQHATTGIKLRLKDKNLSKNENISLLRFTQHPDLQYCGSRTRIRT